MEDKYYNSLCPGCLCAGRKMSDITDNWRKQCFLLILSEIPLSPPEGSVVWLCWECDALVARFARFKDQVKTSYRTLHDYSVQHSQESQSIVQSREPRLSIHNADSLNIHPEQITDQATAQTNVKCIKVENDSWPTWDDGKVDVETLSITKEENDNVSIVSELDKFSNANSFTPSDDEELKYLIDKEDTEKIKRKRGRPRTVSSEKKKITKKGIVKRKKLNAGKDEKFRVVEMSYEEMLEDRAGQLRTEEFLNSVHKCEFCILPFANGDDLKAHMDVKHNETNVYKCVTCACTFVSEVSFAYHRSKHLRRFECLTCTLRLASKRAALRHYDVAHDHTVQQYSCDVCLALYSTEVAYRRHRKTHSIEPQDNPAGNGVDAERTRDLSIDEQKDGEESQSSFPCELCEKTFRWKTSLRKHAELHRIQSGEKKRPYCDACRLTFTTTANLQKHVKTSSKHQIQLKVRKLKESQLGQQEASDKKVDPIEEIKNDIKNALNKFACPHCDKRFQWKGNLLRHVQSHEARASGRLACAPCGRAFSSIATYQQHMNISKKHVTENDFRYMCSQCGKKFANKTRLKDHVDWEHLKNFNHKCQLCQKVFKSNTSLYLHKQVVHRKNDGDHLCDHCGKPFPNRAKLRSHIVAMHTTEQPYKCKFCPATFSWHSCLSRHVKVIHHKVKVKRKRKVKEGYVSPIPCLQ